MDLEDPGRRIETYIGPKSFTKILALVMACAAVILVLIGILSSSGSEKIITEVFDPLDSQTGKDAYLDVVGISDWLVELDSNTWYAAEDEYGYLFIVSVNGSQYKKMAAQQAYWNREDDSAPMPEPYRVNGLVRSFGSGVEKDLAEVTGLSVTEFENFFGDRWLDGKTSESSESGAVWYLGALFAGLFALVLAMSVFPAAVTAKKCLRALEAAGLLERAAMELEAPGAYVLGKDGCRTPRILYSPGERALLPPVRIFSGPSRETSGFISCRSIPSWSCRPQRSAVPRLWASGIGTGRSHRP